MGVETNVGAFVYARQGDAVGRRVRVMFNYAPPIFEGVIVRNDEVAPHRTIIALDDGRYVLSIECQYQACNSF